MAKKGIIALSFSGQFCFESLLEVFANAISRIRPTHRDQKLVCRLHPVHIADVLRWPSDDLAKCQFVNPINVVVGSGAISIIGDFSKEKFMTEWEYVD